MESKRCLLNEWLTNRCSAGPAGGLLAASTIVRHFPCFTNTSWRPATGMKMNHTASWRQTKASLFFTWHLLQLIPGSYNVQDAHTSPLLLSCMTHMALQLSAGRGHPPGSQPKLHPRPFSKTFICTTKSSQQAVYIQWYALITLKQNPLLPQKHPSKSTSLLRTVYRTSSSEGEAQKTS